MGRFVTNLNWIIYEYWMNRAKWRWCFSDLNKIFQYQIQSSILSSSKSSVGTNQTNSSCQKGGRSWTLTLIWPECFRIATDLFVIYPDPPYKTILPQKPSGAKYSSCLIFSQVTRGGCGLSLFYGNIRLIIILLTIMKLELTIIMIIIKKTTM